MISLSKWQEDFLFKIKHALFSDVQRSCRWLLYLLLIVLAIQSFILVNAIASNVVFADAWRHLELYYMKWADGSFKAGDLFSDHHPNAFSALLFILNGELFSLQFKYQAFITMVFKLLLGGFLVYHITVLIRDMRPDLSSRTVVYTIAAYLLLLFYGLNTNAEYTWYLIAESYVMYLAQFVLLLGCDRFMRGQGAVWRRIVPVAVYTVVLYLASITGLKLTLASIIFALLPVLLLSRSYRRNGIILIATLISVYIAVSTTVNALFEITPYPYEMDFEKILMLAENMHKVFLSLAGGVSAGFVNIGLVKSLSAMSGGVYMAALIVVIFALVCFSYIVYYRYRMWEVSFVPIFLAVYLMAFVMSVIVFRTNLEFEISLFKTWPLFIKRYIAAYHIGILGVLLVYIIYFSRVKVKAVYKYIALFIITAGIIHQAYCFYSNWQEVPSIMASQRKVERDMCLYKDDRQVKLHPAITRGNFSEENFDYIVNNRLNIFAEKGPGERCRIKTNASGK